MRIPGQSALVGVAAGAVLAVGGVVAVDAMTDTADAQSSTQVTRAELDAANLRSQRAIKQGTEAWNKVAKYLAEPGELIRARGPVVLQTAASAAGSRPASSRTGRSPPPRSPTARSRHQSSVTSRSRGRNSLRPSASAGSRRRPTRRTPSGAHRRRSSRSSESPPATTGRTSRPRSWAARGVRRSRRTRGFPPRP